MHVAITHMIANLGNYCSFLPTYDIVGVSTTHIRLI